MRYIVKFFPEIIIKSKPVRKQFVKQLRGSLRSVCRLISEDIAVNNEWDFISIDAPNLTDEQQAQLVEQLKCSAGVSFFLEVESCPFETLQDVVDRAVELYSDELQDKTFVVRCKRTGQHEFTSHDAERYIGGGLLQHTNASGVKLKGADVTINIEIKKQIAYLVRRRHEGIGGFPIASLGSVLSLISGGYDSPVASYLTMRRGLSTHYCFFNLGGRAHEVGVKEVAYHLWSRYGMNHKVRFYTVPFEGVIAEILQKVDNAYMGVILKRMMVRAAEKIAQEKNLKALVTGEAVAQVSSQTIVNLGAIDAVSNSLIMRPLATMDKMEIIEKAQEIGTAVFAENMPEYCGVISVKPTTKAKMDRIEYEESRFNFEVLEQAIAATKDERIDELSMDATAEVEEFAFPLGDSVVVDIRHPDECERSPLKLSQKNKIIEIPFFKLSQTMAELDAKQTYCLYCDKGIMSRMHASLLAEEGYSNVAVYRPQ